MSQEGFDFTPSTAENPFSGAEFILEIIDKLKAISSNQSGDAQPTDFQLGQFWVDTSAAPIWTVKINVNGLVVSLFSINSSTGAWATPIANGGTGASTVAGAQEALGLELGADVQPFNAGTVIATEGVLPILSAANLTNVPAPAKATNATVEDNTEDTLMMTMLRTYQAIIRWGRPVGVIDWYGSTTSYSDLRGLFCDGGEYSRDDYPDLWDWHETYGGCLGDGDGSTTFTTPYITNRFIRALPIGASAGTLQADALKSHNHTLSTNWDSGVGSTSRNQWGEGTSSSATTLYSGSTGDSETRPINIQFPAIIYY